MIKRRRQDRLQCSATGGNQTSVLTSAILHVTGLFIPVSIYPLLCSSCFLLPLHTLSGFSELCSFCTFLVWGPLVHNHISSSFQEVASVAC